MEYVIIVISCILAIFVLKFAFNIKQKDMKKIKEIGYDKNLNDITNNLPENAIVCREILSKLENKEVKIESNEDKSAKLTYYSVIGNRIIISNINDTFTRIQTIAHECIHSIQNKRTLLFNFIFSNIYLLYFFLICCLTVFKIISESVYQVIILLLLGIIYYAVRNYLENDAMTKAPYVAKEYIKDSGRLSNEDIQIVMKNYDILNKIGIPLTNFNLLVSVFVKIIIYCVIVTII